MTTLGSHMFEWVHKAFVYTPIRTQSWLYVEIGSETGSWLY